VLAGELDTKLGLGVTPAALRGYPNGERTPPTEIRLGVAEVLGVEPEDCGPARFSPRPTAARVASRRWPPRRPMESVSGSQ
jgi:hypothetical protein